jgi:hypothetical protein
MPGQEKIMNHRTSAIAVVPFAFAAAAFATPEASASRWEPDSAYQSAQIQRDDGPDEGTGYPGYGDQSSTGTVPNQGPPNYPRYDPAYEVRPVEQRNALDTTSVALGALGGIALGGAALGITLGVQRRRDHAELPAA